MKRGLLLLVCALCSLVTQLHASPFYYEEGFDNPAAFADGNTIPANWLSTGTSPLMRWRATDLGLTANSGDYVLGTTPGFSFRDEVVYTQSFELRGGEPCNLSFFLLNPGGPNPNVFYSYFIVTAGTDQNPESQTIEVGTTAKAACTSWTEQQMSFTPEADGVYYLSFKLQSSTPSNCGMVAIDDIVVEGQNPISVPESTELKVLEAAYAEGFDTTIPYIYIGEAIVTHVDGQTAYLQDETAGARLLMPAGTTAKVGDKLTEIACTVAVGKEGIVLTGDETAAWTVVSADNIPDVAEISATDYVANVSKYTNRLVRIGNLNVKGVEAGDVFEDGISYVLTDGTVEIELAFFEMNNLLDEAIPAATLTATGISVEADAPRLAPRTVADLVEDDKPVEHETMPLPYQQSFDNAEDYDGMSQLPIGWSSTGSYPFVTANMNGLPAYDGIYYMISPESKEVRNEHAYTPFFEMKKGNQYEISFFLYLPGNADYSYLRTMDLTVTAGKEQESSAQTNEILAIRGKQFTEWTQQTAVFEPEADGQYCFAFNLVSELNYTGEVAIDLVVIKEKGALVRPKADFSFLSWSDLMDSRTVVFKGMPLTMVNLSTDATEYEWSVEGAEPSTSTEVNPQFTFEQEGLYTVALTAKNSKYQKTTYKEINVKFPEKGANMGLLNYTVADDKNLTSFVDIPTFSTDETYDFASGFNHYYRRMAERFELPADCEITLTSIHFWMVAYSRMTAYRPEDRNFPFTIAAYGETDGKLDESKLFGKKVSTLADEFGDMGIGLEHPKMWMFNLEENPITVKGNFYIAFEFDDKMPIDSDDPNISRSYVAMGMLEHKTNHTSMYVKPTAGPDGFEPDGQWCRLDQLDSELAGLGLYLVLWANIEGNETKLVALNSEGEICPAARVDNNTMTVSGTLEGEKLVVYDVHGKAVKQVRGEADATAFDVNSLPAGVYVVKTTRGTVKVLR